MVGETDHEHVGCGLTCEHPLGDTSSIEPHILVGPRRAIDRRAKAFEFGETIRAPTRNHRPGRQERGAHDRPCAFRVSSVDVLGRRHEVEDQHGIGAAIDHPVRCGDSTVTVRWVNGGDT